MRGMTLIDVLMAIALLGLGGAGFLAMEVTVLRQGAVARQLTEATAAGRAKMEELGYDTTPPPGGSDTVQHQGMQFTRTWTVGAGTPAPLRVQVTWSDGAGQSHQVVLDGQR